MHSRKSEPYNVVTDCDTGCTEDSFSLHKIHEKTNSIKPGNVLDASAIKLPSFDIAHGDPTLFVLRLYANFASYTPIFSRGNEHRKMSFRHEKHL